MSDEFIEGIMPFLGIYLLTRDSDDVKKRKRNLVNVFINSMYPNLEFDKCVNSPDNINSYDAIEFNTLTLINTVDNVELIKQMIIKNTNATDTNELNNYINNEKSINFLFINLLSCIGAHHLSLRHSDKRFEFLKELQQQLIKNNKYVYDFYKLNIRLTHGAEDKIISFDEFIKYDNANISSTKCYITDNFMNTIPYVELGRLYGFTICYGDYDVVDNHFFSIRTIKTINELKLIYILFSKHKDKTQVKHYNMNNEPDNLYNYITQNGTIRLDDLNIGTCMITNLRLILEDDNAPTYSNNFIRRYFNLVMINKYKWLDDNTNISQFYNKFDDGPIYMPFSKSVNKDIKKMTNFEYSRDDNGKLIMENKTKGIKLVLDDIELNSTLNCYGMGFDTSIFKCRKLISSCLMNPDDNQMIECLDNMYRTDNNIFKPSIDNFDPAGAIFLVYRFNIPPLISKSTIDLDKWTNGNFVSRLIREKNNDMYNELVNFLSQLKDFLENNPAILNISNRQSKTLSLSYSLNNKMTYNDNYQVLYSNPDGLKYDGETFKKSVPGFGSHVPIYPSNKINMPGVNPNSLYKLSSLRNKVSKLLDKNIHSDVSIPSSVYPFLKTLTGGSRVTRFNNNPTVKDLERRISTDTLDYYLFYQLFKDVYNAFESEGIQFDTKSFNLIESGITTIHKYESILLELFKSLIVLHDLHSFFRRIDDGYKTKNFTIDITKLISDPKVKLFKEPLFKPELLKQIEDNINKLAKCTKDVSDEFKTECNNLLKQFETLLTSVSSA